MDTGKKEKRKREGRQKGARTRPKRDKERSTETWGSLRPCVRQSCWRGMQTCNLFACLVVDVVYNLRPRSHPTPSIHRPIALTSPPDVTSIGAEGAMRLARTYGDRGCCSFACRCRAASSSDRGLDDGAWLGCGGKAFSVERSLATRTGTGVTGQY